MKTVHDYYQRQFEVVDLAVARIKERFDQPGYAIYRNLEEVHLTLRSSTMRCVLLFDLF